jgi:hypothetical protein
MMHSPEIEERRITDSPPGRLNAYPRPGTSEIIWVPKLFVSAYHYKLLFWVG